jgi:hypothetical protein
MVARRSARTVAEADVDANLKRGRLVVDPIRS